ncbi:hypothetical protein K458DRAFT_471604 [Lentithecium fluviatile CBS 122367]|uniref:Rhodopsin domain-containing protein n=1 Tax=Lentithecium fluviatile CBS 122367 TaxID=1168545 RepID=A0A6G1J7H6_9PLEO|nr:hypothetical protein K458DRAFT_471604 [Lentithecium fluviatile CBS 122367]
MAPQDHVGRIHKQAFVGSTSALFAIAVIAVIARISIRITIQKQFAIDDGILILGLCTLIAAFVVMHVQVIDRMYITVALGNQTPGVVPPGNTIQDIMQLGYDFHKWVTITLMLSWCSIMAAKFSFLAFFWKLIDRVHGMKVYWWAVFILNVGVLGYGASVYYLACPLFNDPRSLECPTGAGKQRLLAHSVSQLALDILGDLLSKIRIRKGQKVALLFSLGLTAFMIVITIIRVSGLIKDGHVDTIWEIYWLALSGEVGIFMAAAIAFRSFFVTRGQSQAWTPPRKESGWFSSAFSKGSRKRGNNDLDTGYGAGLPDIPRAHLTGIRSFIESEGKSPRVGSQNSKESRLRTDNGDEIPLRSYTRVGRKHVD